MENYHSERQSKQGFSIGMKSQSLEDPYLPLEDVTEPEISILKRSVFHSISP